MPDLLERLKAALADRYAVESEIGRGGMATVFLAEDIKHHRKVAIKVLHPELAAAVGGQRFLQEIETVASLNHPHILPLHDSGETQGLLYYVMPFAEGESLRHRLDRENQLAVDESVRIAVEVADGLDYAHRKGVVHRDIKPGNILLSEGHAVIADFGIARAIEAAQRERITSTGLGVGTPLYASPEQATAQETLDGRTDIYSLACVLYETLAGEPPLTGATPQMIRARRMSETPTAVHTIRDTVPPALDLVIAKALARVPADRFATASQLRQALQAALAQATPSEQVPRVTAGAAHPSRSSNVTKWRLAVLSFLIVALALTLRAMIAGSDWTRPPFDITTSNFVQVTNRLGLEFQPALSPDGSEVVYVEGPIEAPSIVVRNALELGTGESRLAEAMEGYNLFPSWTADGSSVRFWNCWHRWRPRSGCDWKQVGSRGGPVRGLGIPAHDRMAWSPDGTRVVFAHMDSIYVASLGEGEATLLAVQPSDAPLPHSFSWSPNGELIAYAAGNLGWRTTSNIANASIWVVGTDGGTPAAVTDHENLSVSPQWLPDSRHLLFVSDREGARGVYVVELDRGGAVGSPKPVPGAVDPHSISVSANGKRLAYSRYTVRKNVWRIPVAGLGTVSMHRDLASAVPITTGNHVIEAFDLSPDGAWIAFDNYRRGEFDIYRQRLGGGEPELVADIDGHAYAPLWSPDGTELLFDGGLTSDVFVVSANGGTPQKLVDKPGQDGWPLWAPDGLSIVYRSWKHEPGSPRGYRLWRVVRERVGAPWNPPVKISERRCAYHTWMPDGQNLLCVLGDEWTVLSIDGESRGTLDRPTGMESVQHPQFSPDGSRLYFRGIHEDGREGIWWMPARGGELTLAVAFDDPSVGIGSIQHRDDVVILAFNETESDIWVMELDW